MKITLNIGLGGTKGSRIAQLHTHQHAANRLAATVGRVVRSRVDRSATELTLIAEIVPHKTSTFGVCEDIYDLSEDLGQDCIAWKDANGTGLLTGKDAHKWEPFDEAFFLPLEP